MKNKKTDGDDETYPAASGSLSNSPKPPHRDRGISVFIKMGLLLVAFICISIFNLHRHPQHQISEAEKGLHKFKKDKEKKKDKLIPVALQAELSPLTPIAASALRIENEKLKKEVGRLRDLVKGVQGGIYFCPDIGEEVSKSGVNPLKDKYSASFFKPDFVAEQFYLCNNNMDGKIDLLTSALVDTFESFSEKICELMTMKSIPYGEMHLAGAKNPIDCCDGRFNSYYSLIFALEKYDILPNSLWLDFGVSHGYALNVTSITRERTRPYEIQNGNLIHGFGSVSRAFTDLQVYNKTRRGDIRLYEGSFNKTLPEFLMHLDSTATTTSSTTSATIGWININDGLYYDETLDILNHAIPSIRRGSVLHFRQPIFGKKKKCLPRQEMRALYDFMNLESNRNLRLQIAQFVNPLFPWSVIFKVV